MAFLEGLNADEGIKLIIKAFEKRNEEMMFQRWIPLQTEYSFDDFKEMLTPTKAKPEEEIIDDVMKIIEGINKNGII